MLPRALFSALLMLAMVVTVHVARAEVAIVVRGTSSSSAPAAAIDETKLAALIRLELGSGERAALIDRIAIEITGSRPRAVIITITNRDGSVRSSDLDIDLTGRSGERAIALFVGELSRGNVDAAPQPAPTPTPATTTTATSAPVVDAPPRAPREEGSNSNNNGLMLDARGSGRVIGLGASEATLMPGVAVAAGVGLGDRARVGLNGRYGVASADDPLGGVNARTANGGAHAAYRFFPSRSFFIDTGPRAMIGWIGGEGTSGGAAATKANSTSGVVVEGAWFADATLIIARPIGIVLGLEAGWLGPGLDLRADDRRVLRVAGAFAGLSLGLAVLP